MIAVVAIIVAVAVGLEAAARWHRRRREARWTNDRARLERYGEHLAARNGHPDGGLIAVVPTRNRDTP